MVKLLGSLFVLGGGLLAAWQGVLEGRRRWDTLSDMMVSLRRMAEEIRMARTPLLSLMETLAESCHKETGAFFLQAVGAIRRGDDLASVWKEAAEELTLAEQDRKTVAAVGDSLQGDEENVCKAISLAVYELAKSAEQWERIRPEEAKRRLALWISGAALLVILLI